MTEVDDLSVPEKRSEIAACLERGYAAAPGSVAGSWFTSWARAFLADDYRDKVLLPSIDDLHDVVERAHRATLWAARDLARRDLVALILWRRFVDRWLPEYLEALDDEPAPSSPEDFVEKCLRRELARFREIRGQRRPELGVLFVHGIGEQRRGATLLSWGGALLGQVGARVEAPWSGLQVPIWRSSGGSEQVEAVAVRHVRLGGEDSGVPSHAVVDLPRLVSDEIADELRQGRPGRLAQAPEQLPWRSWLLAESSWQSAIHEPRMGELLRWLALVGPWLAVSQIGSSLYAVVRQLETRGVLRAVAHVMAFLLFIVAAVPLVVTLEVTVAVLAVASIVPIRPVRTVVRSVAYGLQTTIGDSFEFSVRPLSRQAILSRVRDDLEWLAKRVEKVCVVAHSQGAAIAHSVLSRDLPDNVVLLVTFGSGWHKLRETASRARAARWAPVVVTATPAIVTVAWWTRTTSLGWYLLLFLVSFYLVGYRGLRDVRLEQRDLVTPAFAWRDYYATHDPVAGPHRDDTPHASVSVVNQKSVLRDHTRYWDNEAFIASVQRDMEYAGGTRPRVPRSDADGTVAQLMGVRRRRVAALAWARRVLLATAVGALVAARVDLATIGAVELGPITASSVDVVAGLLETLSGWLGIESIDPSAPARVGRPVVAGIALVGSILLWYWLVHAVWRWWDQRARVQVVHGEQVGRVLGLIAQATIAGLTAVGVCVAATSVAVGSVTAPYGYAADMIKSAARVATSPPEWVLALLMPLGIAMTYAIIWAIDDMGG